jgi:hypothetical protein
MSLPPPPLSNTEGTMDFLNENHHQLERNPKKELISYCLSLGNKYERIMENNWSVSSSSSTFSPTSRSPAASHAYYDFFMRESPPAFARGHFENTSQSPLNVFIGKKNSQSPTGLYFLNYSSLLQDTTEIGKIALTENKSVLHEYCEELRALLRQNQTHYSPASFENKGGSQPPTIIETQSVAQKVSLIIEEVLQIVDSKSTEEIQLKEILNNIHRN